MSVRSRWPRVLALIVLLLAVVVVGVPATRHSMLRALGGTLVVDEPIEPADVIVVPKWAGGAGAIEAADLVHRGIANRVALLREPPQPADQELTRRGVHYVDGNAGLVELLHTLGVANVDIIPDAAGGTEAEGEVLLSWGRQRQIRSMIVVSTPDHSRRVRRVLHRVSRGHPTRVMVRAARYSPFEPDTWWTTREGIRTEIVELQKLLLDVIRHPLS